MNVSDVLNQNGSNCHLNLAVQYDPLLKEDILAVGLSTFVKSSYLVYNFHDGKE